ncbi:MAG: dockerin type I domain-containing protein [Candidatus Daviesbacteria bacterium]|nr:dockerin type I domain-containing protein [Candidatus Daviesbacteria bacterium]
MQLARNQIIALVGFVIILISIPVSFYLVKQTQTFRSKASENIPTPTPVTKPLPAQASNTADLLKAMQGSETSSSSATPTGELNLAFGPTLNLTLSIEGRPKALQAGKVFVGLSAGGIKTNPTYILTFTIDVPDSGIFKGISLAGLNPGSNYTAYIKGASQIDNASNFTMSPTETNLNDGKALTLISGDLNEDNTINAADYSICKGLYGTTPKSSNWNSRADFNKDNIVNNYDLIIITKNMGKVGASGPWVSTPQSSTPSSPSAELINKPNVGGPPADFGSILSASTNSAIPEEPTHSPYWLYVP